MNLNSIVTLLFVIGALWVAAALLTKHGVLSFDTWLGPIAIWAVAFLVLYIGNTFAMGPIKGQASGLAVQTVGLVNSAAPALNLPAQPESLVNPSSGNTSFGGGNSSGNETISGGDTSGATTFSSDGQQNQAVVVAPPITPPQIGELKWGGTMQPAYNDDTMPFQAACFANSQTLTTMLSQGYVPSGVQVQIIPGATFFHQPEKETWTIKVLLPHQQLGAITWTTDGITARAIKKAIGGDSVNGTGNWPLVKQSFDGTNFITVQPVECEYR